jgi:WD40 repeat protein
VIAASCLDSTIRLWEVANGKKFCTIDAGPVDIWTVAFSPDSKHVITGSHSGKIFMYGIDGSLEQTLDTRGKFTLSIAYVRTIFYGRLQKLTLIYRVLMKSTLRVEPLMGSLTFLMWLPVN